MINRELLDPQSIAIIGGSNNIHKPGGAIVRNLLQGDYKGVLRIVNPKEDEVQGIKVFHDVRELPPTELAVLVIPAKLCPDTVALLASEKEQGQYFYVSILLRVNLKRVGASDNIADTPTASDCLTAVTIVFSLNPSQSYILKVSTLSVVPVLQLYSSSRVLSSRGSSSIVFGQLVMVNRLVLRMFCSTWMSTSTLRPTHTLNCYTLRMLLIPTNFSSMPAVSSARDVALLPSRQEAARVVAGLPPVIRGLLPAATLP